jgi:Anti-sigma-28 factor, FlgM
MQDHRDIRLQELRERITNGEYRVDPHAVATAIVRRRWSVAIALLPEPVSPIASPDRPRARVRRIARTRALVGAQDLAA